MTMMMVIPDVGDDNEVQVCCNQCQERTVERRGLPFRLCVATCRCGEACSASNQPSIACDSNLGSDGSSSDEVDL